MKITHGEDITTTDYTFDGLNRLKTVTDSQGETTYSYYDTGSLHTIRYPNGVVTEHIYNEVNQLTELTSKDANDQQITHFSYGLDNTGRREDLTELNGRFIDYTYDDLYRLTDEQVTDPVNGDYAASYNYDWVGNRAQSDLSPEFRTMTLMKWGAASVAFLFYHFTGVVFRLVFRLVL